MHFQITSLNCNSSKQLFHIPSRSLSSKKFKNFSKCSTHFCHQCVIYSKFHHPFFNCQHHLNLSVTLLDQISSFRSHCDVIKNTKKSIKIIPRTKNYDSLKFTNLIEQKMPLLIAINQYHQCLTKLKIAKIAKKTIAPNHFLP